MLSFHNKLILTRSSLHLRSSKWFNSKSGLDQVEQKLSKIHSFVINIRGIFHLISSKYIYSFTVGLKCTSINNKCMLEILGAITVKADLTPKREVDFSFSPSMLLLSKAWKLID